MNEIIGSGDGMTSIYLVGNQSLTLIIISVVLVIGAIILLKRRK